MRSKLLIFLAIFLAFVPFVYTFNPKSSIADSGEHYRMDETLKVRLPEDVSAKQYLDYQLKILSRDDSLQISQKVNARVSEALAANPMVEPFYEIVNQDWTDIQTPVSNIPTPQSAQREGNQITYVPVTDINDEDNCGRINEDEYSTPWTSGEEIVVTDIINRIYPSLFELFGYPFENETVKIYHCPYLASAGQLVIGSPNIPGHTIIPKKIYVKWTNFSDEDRQATIWHEMTHSWFGFYKNMEETSQWLWSEPIAQLGAYLTESRYGLPHSVRLPIENSNYEQYNRPELQRNGITNTQVPSGAITVHYTTGSGVWYKLYFEHPDILKRFTDKVYTDYYSVIAASKRTSVPFLSAGLKILDDIIKSSDSPVVPPNTIEGESIFEWFPKQYGLIETIANEKLGARLLPSGKLYLGYYITRVAATPEFPLFTPLSGEATYELYNGQNQIIHNADPFIISGDSETDLSAIIKQGLINFPQERICAKASLGANITSSCYYFTGNAPPEQSGIYGTIGNEDDDIVSGTVTVIPSEGQFTQAKTYSVENGGFIASGDNNEFYEFGGRYRIDFLSADRTKKASKYITKGPNTQYHTNLSLADMPFVLTGLSSKVIEYITYIRPIASKPVAIAYYSSRSSFLEGILELYQKTWGSSQESKNYNTSHPIHTGDSYKINIYDPNGQGVCGNQSFSYASSPYNYEVYEDVFFSKWSDKKTVLPGESVKYSIGVSNLKDSVLTGSISDPVNDFVSAGFQPPENISDDGIYDPSTKTLSWSDRLIASKEQIIYSFDMRL